MTKQDILEEFDQHHARLREILEDLEDLSQEQGRLILMLRDRRDRLTDEDNLDL